MKSRDQLFNEVIRVCFNKFEVGELTEEESESIMDDAQLLDDVGLQDLLERLTDETV